MEITGASLDIEFDHIIIGGRMLNLLLAFLILAVVFALCSGVAHRPSYVQSDAASKGLGFVSASALIFAMIVLWKEVLTPFVTDSATAGMATGLIAILTVFVAFIAWGFYRLGTKLGTLI